MHFEKKYQCAKVQLRIRKLQEKKFCGFAQIKTPNKLKSLQPRLNKDMLTLKRAKKVKRLDVYISQSQKHLNKFFRQLKTIF